MNRAIQHTDAPPAFPGNAARPRAGGFTLIELAAVVVIVALLYGFAVPNLGIRSRRALDSEVEGLRAELELTRVRAIATGTPHRLAIDLDQARFHMERFEIVPPSAPAAEDSRGRIDLSAPQSGVGSFQPVPDTHGKGRRMPEDIFVRSIETAEGPTDRGQVAVAFWQDGSASPARIQLANDSGDALELEVLPLADTVRVHVLD